MPFEPPDAAKMFRAILDRKIQPCFFEFRQFSVKCLSVSHLSVSNESHRFIES